MGGKFISLCMNEGRYTQKKKKEEYIFVTGGGGSRVYRLAVMMAIIRPFNNDETRNDSKLKEEGKT
jgi:hypothetical protein